MSRQGRAADRLIVALDFTEGKRALAMARRLRGYVTTVKVGSVLFTACGPAIIQRLRTLGFEVMLDLKFFDIPSTVELSCRAAAAQRVTSLTVHACGGRRMLEAAVQGSRDAATRLRVLRPAVLAVTKLTSASADASASTVKDVLGLAREAAEAGCDGVIASAQEAKRLRRTFKHQLTIVCPGIRPLGVSREDQQRVATPAQALAAGADRLVVGRPITAAADPKRAIEQMLQEMEEVL